MDRRATLEFGTRSKSAGRRASFVNARYEGCVNVNDRGDRDAIRGKVSAALSMLRRAPWIAGPIVIADALLTLPRDLE